MNDDYDPNLNNVASPGPLDTSDCLSSPDEHHVMFKKPLIVNEMFCLDEVRRSPEDMMFTEEDNVHPAKSTSRSHATTVESLITRTDAQSHSVDNEDLLSEASDILEEHGEVSSEHADDVHNISYSDMTDVSASFSHEQFSHFMVEEETSQVPTPSAEWIQYESPEGYPYYYNNATGESSWEAPPSMITEEPVQSKILPSSDASVKSMGIGSEISGVPSQTSSPTSAAASRGRHSARTIDSNSKLARQNKQGQTPLHMCASSCMPDGLALLLQQSDVEVNCLNRDGLTALQLVCVQSPCEEQYQCMSLLLRAGADANAIDSSNNTPLHSCLLHHSKNMPTISESDTLRAVRLLLRHGADVSIENANGDSPLHLATQYRLIAVMHALLSPAAVGEHSDISDDSDEEKEEENSQHWGDKQSDAPDTYEQRPSHHFMKYIGSQSDTSTNNKRQRPLSRQSSHHTNTSRLSKNSRESQQQERYPTDIMNSIPLYDDAYSEMARNETQPASSAENWQTCTTEDGNIYYYNTVTGTTQWEYPSELSSNLTDQNNLQYSTPADDTRASSLYRDISTSSIPPTHPLSRRSRTAFDQQYSSAPLTVSTDSLVTADALLSPQSLAYSSTSDLPSKGMRTVSYSASDASLGFYNPSNSATSSLSMRTAQVEYPGINTRYTPSPPISGSPDFATPTAHPPRSHSVSSLSDDGTAGSSVTDRHLEVWGKFMENAMKLSELKQRRQQHQSSVTKGAGSRRKSNLTMDKWAIPPATEAYLELLEIVESSLPDEDVEDLRGTALLAAVMRSDVEVAERLLRRGIFASCLDEQDRTPLHHASRNSNVELVSLLNDYEADIDSKDLYGQTALHVACKYGHLDVVQCLLQCGASVNAVDAMQNTPLHMAASRGHSEIVTVMLEYGSDPHALNVDGHTPLQMTVDLLMMFKKRRRTPTLGIRNTIRILENKTQAITDHDAMLLSSADEALSVSSQEDDSYRSKGSQPQSIDARTEAWKARGRETVNNNRRAAASDNVISSTAFDDIPEKVASSPSGDRSSGVRSPYARGRIGNNNTSLLEQINPGLTVQTKPPQLHDSDEDDNHSADTATSSQSSSALGAVGSTVWGAASTLFGAFRAFTGGPDLTSMTMTDEERDDKQAQMSRKTKKSEDIAMRYRDAPPTDGELRTRGLGFHPPPPPVTPLEDHLPSPKPPPFVARDMEEYVVRTGTTPRRGQAAVPPPDEVVVAVEMARAAERHRRTPQHQKPLAPIVADTKPYVLHEPPSSNGYSMGTMPQGSRWRYVDILNSPPADVES